MCRISGIFDNTGSIRLEQVEAMRDAMRRGGPDGAGRYSHESLPLHLAHRRLALIDLTETGQQPMYSTDKKTVLVYNGELYNYQELKIQLQSLGCNFNSHSDTEVVLQAYQQWGLSCFERFNGMFALAIWDEHLQKITLARDHAGIKPLYFHLSEKKGLVFASEIRAFKQLDPHWPENNDWQAAFMLFGHLPEPYTTLQDVVPLEKGTWLQIEVPSLQYKTGVHTQFSFRPDITQSAEALTHLREVLPKAVKRHLISDAPIGLFLSGGIDSSLLTLLAQPYIGQNLKTLSITFEDATLNEAPYQKIIADKTGAHHESFLVTEQEFKEHLPEIIEAMDQPSTDGINSYFISYYARNYGLTAVLSGIGADELFGGYPSFTRANHVAKLRKIPAFLPGLAEYLPSDKFKKLSFFEFKNDVAGYLFNRGAFSLAQTAALTGKSKADLLTILEGVRLHKPKGIKDNRDTASWLETNLYMQNQLLKDSDYMSMWHSLEIRVPFLDKEVMNVAFSIDPSIKYHPTIGKHLLIEAFKDLLPDAIWNRKKMGFTFPFYQWMHSIQAQHPTPHYTHIRNQYLSGKLHWSRYWNFLISQDARTICYANS